MFGSVSGKIQNSEVFKYLETADLCTHGEQVSLQNYVELCREENHTWVYIFKDSGAMGGGWKVKDKS